MTFNEQRQIAAVLNEYRNAVQDGAITLAAHIVEANPDLHESFRNIAIEFDRRGGYASHEQE